MDKSKLINYISDIIKNYINNKKQLKRIANNMLYYRNTLKKDSTLKQAFMFVMQSTTSIYTDLSTKEQEYIASELWEALVRKNHSLTKLWQEGKKWV